MGQRVSVLLVPMISVSSEDSQYSVACIDRVTLTQCYPGSLTTDGDRYLPFWFKHISWTEFSTWKLEPLICDISYVEEKIQNISPVGLAKFLLFTVDRRN